MFYRRKDEGKRFYGNKTLFNCTVTVTNTKNCTGIVTHFTSKPTNRGLVEVHCMWKGSKSRWRSWYGNTVCLHI